MLKKTSILYDVLFEYFQFTMTIPPVPQVDSPLPKHKKYMHDTLLHLFPVTLRSSLLKLAVMNNPTIIPESKRKVYEKISLLLGDLEVKYKPDTRCKDQSSQELERLNKLEASKANITAQFASIEEKRLADLELQAMASALLVELQNQMMIIQQEISILQFVLGAAITRVNDYNEKKVELFEKGNQLDKDIASLHKQKHLLLQTLEKIDKELAQDDMEWGGFQDMLIQAQSPVAVVLISSTTIVSNTPKGSSSVS